MKEVLNVDRDATISQRGVCRFVGSPESADLPAKPLDRGPTHAATGRCMGSSLSRGKRSPVARSTC